MKRIMPPLMLTMVVGFILTVLVGCSTRPEWNGTVGVRLLPDGDVVDLTRGPLPPLPGAQVKVEELDLTVNTDQEGAARLTLPLGRTEGWREDEGVYTFVVTSPHHEFQTTVRRRITVEEPAFEIHYNPGRHVYQDYVPGQ